MLAQSMPLPPLKASNQQKTESLTAANIRSDMNKIQQSLQRSNQIYNDYFSDIPPNISESLQIIQDYQDCISKEIQKNKLDLLKAKLRKYNYVVDSLSTKLQQHVDKSLNGEQTDFFAEVFPSFEQSLLEQNQKVLESFEKLILQKVDYYEQKAKVQSDTPKYKFKSPFTSSNPKKQIQKSSKQAFSTLDTVLDLKKHNQRIQSLESKVNILLNKQKETEAALKNDTSREVAESVIKNHQQIKQLSIKSQVLTKKIEYQPLQNKNDQPSITFKSQSNVEQHEFDQFSQNVNELNEKILAQIESFENFSEQKINGFIEAVDSIELKIVDFENSVNSLNKLMANVNEKIERAEENYDEIALNKISPKISHSDISKLIESFKLKLSAIQDEAINEIEQLRLQLSLLENECSI
ncbi:hypothetical protein M9Y10_012880 [Tritrichomonas musculus]|uniref:Uncharacterized protein n=1 Tax=Tritrichomonas musculus TaxID=1915356 RepID=A0ABR2IEP9_9EUKA